MYLSFVVIFADNRKRVRTIIFYENYFIEFYMSLDNKVREKVKYVLELIKQVDRVPDKFLTQITDYEGLFEIRVEYQSNIYRIFCCFDSGKLVILFNGFQKKTQKTAKEEIERAMRLMSAYFETRNGRK